MALDLATHTHKCHCGKRANRHVRHVTRGEGCANVCGAHGRTRKGVQYQTHERALSVCRGCGDHIEGAQTSIISLARTAWDAGDWHRECHRAARDAHEAQTA